MNLLTQTTMINYSIVMRSVNANLLAINQAKSRINQAKKEGKEPEKEDLDLVKTEKQNAFAVSQYTDIMTIEKFAKHITSHGSVYSRADISAILYMAVDCMREMLLEGKKIRLGDLGDSAGTIIGCHHRLAPIGTVGIVIRPRSTVPMGTKQRR